MIEMLRKAEMSLIKKGLKHEAKAIDLAVKRIAALERSLRVKINEVA